MTGCRHNAKNTLVKNYLHLAESNGATVLPLTTVTRVAPRDGGGYDVHVRYTKAKVNRRTSRRVLTAEQVVFAASALGTQRLLHQMKDEGHLPRVSDRLGYLSRTNSESIGGVIAPGHERRLQPGHRDHLELPPRREHPHRAGPLRPGQQPDVAAAVGAHRRRRRRAALADLAARDVGAAPRRRQPLRHEALVGAHRDRAGHAEPRQLDHDVHQADPVHPQALRHLQAGSRRAEPDLDPGRQRGDPDDGRDHGRLPGQRRRRRRSTSR